jgi:hypothetical protein
MLQLTGDEVDRSAREPGLGRKKILLVHQDLSQTGGARAVCAWTIQALKDDFELTLLMWTTQCAGEGRFEFEFRLGQWLRPNA